MDTFEIVMLMDELKCTSIELGKNIMYHDKYRQ